ncbi:MAG: caspase family protein [Pyrinomonadaceae bacterium]
MRRSIKVRAKRPEGKICGPQTAVLRLLPSIFLAIVLFGLIESSVVARSDKKNLKSAPAPKLALLVGINDYQTDWRDLSGTHNDVDLMKGLLREFGFIEKVRKAAPADAPCGGQTEDSPLKTLCSGQATRKAILDMFDRHLIENARLYKEKNKTTPDQGAAVVFYYSGHGSFLPDDNGDEADGNDETIVPTDADMDGKNQIRDDEFSKRVQILSQFTTNITFILDSCHSGTATRGGGAKNDSSGARRGGGTVLSDGIDSRNFYVTISGSLPNELAREDYFPDPETRTERLNGTLTYHFAYFLRRHPRATYRELMNLVRNAVVGLGRNQTPQAEGDIDRVVFGSIRPAGKNEARSTDENLIPYIFPKCNKVRGRMRCSEEVAGKDGGEPIQLIKMDAGRMVGARPGGMVVVYGPEARQLSGDDEMIASGLITEADNFDSEAEVILRGDRFKTVPENAKIVLVAPNFTDEKRKVIIDLSPGSTARGGADPLDPGIKSMNRLAESLKENPYLEPVRATGMLEKLERPDARRSPEGDWNVAVVRATFRDFKFGNRQRTVRGEAGTPADKTEIYFLADRNGMPLYGFWVRADDPDAAKLIKEALESHVRIENLRNLGNRAAGFDQKIGVKLVRLREEGGKLVPVKEDENDIDREKIPQLKENDKFYFQITNQSQKDLYLYIYSLATDGKIDLIYPPTGAKEVLTRGSSLTTNEEDGNGSFYIVPGTPPGRETIKIIASVRDFPADMLISPEIASGKRDGLTPLEKLLKRTVTNRRGEEVPPISVGGWAAFNFDYEVVP